ncbi:signal recognition particle-docking protein FtsY [Tabrizicola sp.]|uniref:signal recognition particle-docking protein FtsY n=1 Tax=Tabrizicola sp. TaxID=2005166 RepID=UPI00273726CA|nr:signal recognition particle-docking protein FtsY [Tabrizicola sp.]MDP3197043.1 signal recognition particle-docking protein FtsY [Tabrizicola sp.]
MSFFKKLKERMFRSSDKIGEGLDALVAEGAEGPKDPLRELPDRIPELPEPPAPELPEPDLPELPEPVEVEPDLPMPEDPMPIDQGGMTVVAPEPGPAKPGLLGRLFGRTTVEEPRRILDDAMLESLEELLIQADMGVDTAVRVTANIAEGRFGRRISTRELRAALAAEVARIMEPVARPMPLYPQKPQVVLVVGVNGSGKTTTIGKLASQFKAAGKTVVIAAGDTFRAAAVEQLQIWGQRAGVPVLTAPEGSDPASLAFDALTKARADGADLLMIDTAGRLQNRQDLMEELAKIVRVIRKVDPSAPHNTLLVLDATTGQNAVAQVDIFRKIADVSGLVMTKLDGTAKGGVLVALADRFGLPIHAIGVGEQIDDLAPFDPEDFARALVGAEG